MSSSVHAGNADTAAKLEAKMKKMADKYGFYTKEEILEVYNKMERMNIGVFVTPFGKP